MMKQNKDNPAFDSTKDLRHIDPMLFLGSHPSQGTPESEMQNDSQGTKTFTLLFGKDLPAKLNPPPLYMLGVLLRENLCQVFEYDYESTNDVYLYTVSEPEKLPPFSLVQIMYPHWKGKRLMATAVAYFSPRDGYRRMGWFGIPLPDCRWRGPDPVQLMEKPMPPWPQLAPGGKADKANAPVAPPSYSGNTPTLKPTPHDEDLLSKIEENQWANLRQDPVVGKFAKLMEENADEETLTQSDQPASLPPSMNKESLAVLYKANYRFYSQTAHKELDTLLKGSDILNAKQLNRAQMMLRYAYTRKKKYTPIPINELREKLEKALPGQQDVVALVLARAQTANRVKKPLTLLILDEEDAAAEEIVRCLCEVMPDGARLDANVGDLGLTGLNFSYDSAVTSQTIQKMDGPLLCIDSCEAVFWGAENNKDSAAPAFTALLRGRTFTDKFLNVPVNFYGHIVARARDLEPKYRSLFAQVLEVPLRTVADKIAILQAKAKACIPAFTLNTEMAKALMQQYAPGSLRRAFGCLDLLVGYIDELGLTTLQPGDLRTALGEPCLSQDEELVSQLEGCADALPMETAREAAHQIQVLLAPGSGEQKRDTARRMLCALNDLLHASHPVPLPPAQDMRTALNTALLGLEEEKDLVISTLYASGRKMLFFCGAPGTGKTALARALAKASGRTLVRVDMAALLPDTLTGQASVHGVGGNAGILVQRIARAGKPCVVLLDEIDKTTEAVANRLLELFENDRVFDDAFVGRVDLKEHLFLLSGNSLHITRPLLDRCQVVQMQPYTPGEKAALLQLKWNAALCEEKLPCQPLDKELVRQVVARCASGGVRDIENAAERMVRLVAAGHPLPQTAEAVHRLLGGGLPAPQPIRNPGTVYCLAALENGGGLVSPLQVAENPNGARLQTLGMVDSATMRESCEMTLAVAARILNCSPPALLVAMDASRKDGPSGGAAIFLAVYSLMTGTVLKGVAATGELMLDGSILPVGGVPSKLIGAVRCAGLVRTVLLPAANRADVPEKLSEEAAAAGIALHYVANVQEAIALLPHERAVQTQQPL